jgi:alpha-D-ribose 1-methylphosphonate 5-triphosphate diphosphatase
MLACAVRMAEEGMALPAAINLLTLNPARHLGIDDRTGSIEVGKQADLVAFHPRKGFGDVSRVWVDGKERYSSLKDWYVPHAEMAQSLPFETSTVPVGR